MANLLVAVVMAYLSSARVGPNGEMKQLVDDRVLSDDLAAMLALLRADALAQPLEDAP